MSLALPYHGLTPLEEGGLRGDASPMGPVVQRVVNTTLGPLVCYVLVVLPCLGKHAVCGCPVMVGALNAPTTLGYIHTWVAKAEGGRGGLQVMWLVEGSGRGKSCFMRTRRVVIRAGLRCWAMTN